MKADTAICFGFGGQSLFFVSGSEKGSRSKIVSNLLATGTVLVGALTLAEYLTGYRFGLDELLFKDLVASAAPGRMAPFTAINFCAVGVALILLQFPRRIVVAHILAGSLSFPCWRR